MGRNLFLRIKHLMGFPIFATTPAEYFFLGIIWKIGDYSPGIRQKTLIYQ
jgi:hypothetical protein